MSNGLGYSIAGATELPEATNATRVLYHGDDNRGRDGWRHCDAAPEWWQRSNRLLYTRVNRRAVAGAVQRISAYGLNRISQCRTAGTGFYGYDGNGNVRVARRRAGTITDRYEDDAFGSIISRTGSAVNAYLYSGEQNDPLLGFQCVRAEPRREGYSRQARGCRNCWPQMCSADMRERSAGKGSF